jgi:hypothetical protein
VQKRVKIFELAKHFVRLRIGNEVWVAGDGSGFWIGPAAPGKFRTGRDFKQGEMYHAF